MGFFAFWGESVLNFKLNAFFSRSQNTPRMSRERNRIIFSKKEQTIVSYWRFSHETKGKLENINLMFSICNHIRPSDLQQNTLNYIIIV